MNTSGVANAIWVGINSVMNAGLKSSIFARPSCLIKETQWRSAFQRMTGENIKSETTPPRYGHGEISQRRSFGMATSQIRIARPKNIAVYFDNSAAPTAAPTASHHAPRPVSRTFARENKTKQEGTSDGASRVT